MIYDRKYLGPFRPRNFKGRHASPVVSSVHLLIQKDLISLCPFHPGGDLGNQLEESDVMSIEVKIADLGSACWTVSLL